MLKKLLYLIVNWIAMIHDMISKMNNRFEGILSDKQLHFLVIGLLGMLLVLLIHPLFRFLVSRNRVMVITCLYVFTLILVITFAVEIGQRFTNTGNMEFADIVFGVGGFIVLFAVYAFFRTAVPRIARRIRRERENPGARDLPDS